MSVRPPSGGIWQLGALVYGIPMSFAALSHGPLLIGVTIVVALIAWFHGKELNDFEHQLAQEREAIDAREKVRAGWFAEWSAIVAAYDEGDLDHEDWEAQRDELLERLPP